MGLTLKDICTIKTGKLDANAAEENGIYPFFTCSKNPLRINKYSFDCKCVLLGGNGEFNVNMYNGKFDAYQRTYVIESKDESKYSLELIYYIIKNSIQHFKNISNGGVIKFIKLGDIQNIEFPEISISEQRNIVKYLNGLNKAITNVKSLLFKNNGLVKSRFIEMFGTLDMSEQRDDWMRLDEVSEIVTGTTPSTREDDNWDGDILWVTPAELKADSFYVNDTARKITEKGRKSKALDLMPVGTVLLSSRAPIGKVAIVGKPMTCNQGFKNFICGSKINPIYLYVFLKNNSEYLNSIGSGTTFLEVSKSTISKTKIPVPPIETQNEFAQFVEQIDKSKLIIQQQIKNLQELLDAKMNEIFG